MIVSRGWLYHHGAPLSAYDLQEPWIRMILGFIGVTDIDFVVAEGVARLERGKVAREHYLQLMREQVRRKAAHGLPTARG